MLHTKLWVIDKKHAYLGSANMDWRSLTQVSVQMSFMFNTKFKLMKLTFVPMYMLDIKVKMCKCSSI